MKVYIDRNRSLNSSRSQVHCFTEEAFEVTSSRKSSLTFSSPSLPSPALLLGQLALEKGEHNQSLSE